MAQFMKFMVAGAAAQSVTNCGSSSDHIRIDSVVLDADATGGPRKGKPFTITATGGLDKAHTLGTVVIDAQLKALGIVNEPIQLTQGYEFLPGLAAGEGSTVTIGPILFPRAIPGEFDFTGKVTIVDENQEPVICLDLNLNIPKILGEEEELEASKICEVTDSDHIRNFQYPDDNTITMDLDEDLEYVGLGVDLAVKVPLLPAVSAQLSSIPISWSPAIPAGQMSFRGIDAVKSLKSQLMDVITVTGALQLSDANGEQETCVIFSDDSSVSV